MECKYFYYSKPLAYFATVLVGFMDVVLVIACLAAGKSAIFLIVFAAVLGVTTFFFLKNALTLAVRHTAVLIADDKGLTDIISWGLIEWSNIASMNAAISKTNTTSFKVLRIVLKDKDTYAEYNNSWWIRIKMAWCRVMNKADIVIDIDALEGGGEAVFTSLKESWEYYEGLHSINVKLL